MSNAPSEIAVDDVDLGAYDAIIDVRPSGIRARLLPGARNVPMDQLMGDPGAVLPSGHGSILVVCDLGVRSHIAARWLSDMGYRADSLAGGLEAWAEAGRPIIDSPELDPVDRERYDRHIKLAEFGVDGQVAVRDAVVTMVGAGGLGVPAAQYLAAAGVGRLRIVDDDHVEVSNLQRQPAYRTADVGAAKATTMARTLEAVNPTIAIEALTERLTATNADRLLTGSDVVVDATDRFSSRYAISDAGQRLGIPVVFGAVYRWEGQLAVFAPGGPCYRCLFPAPPEPGVALDCAVTGVLGPVVGTLGSMQATETLRMLTSPADVATDRLTLFDARRRATESVALRRRSGCEGCSIAERPV